MNMEIVSFLQSVCILQQIEEVRGNLELGTNMDKEEIKQNTWFLECILWGILVKFNLSLKISQK